MTPNDVKKLEQDIRSDETALSSKKSLLESIQRVCQHKWGEVQYVPIATKGYQIEGDPPGTMGVDWRGPMWVEGTTTKQWQRTCCNCHKVQTTQRTKTANQAGSIPGTSATVEVPDFGDR